MSFALGAAVLVLGVLRQGELVEVGADEVIEEDLYAAGSTINVLGRVTGDVVAAGGTVTISGQVGGDVLAVGGTLIVSGEVEGSVRAAGGQVSLRGPVGMDAALAGGELHVGSTSRIGNDVLAAGGSTELDGPVEGDLWAAAGELAIRAPVNGSVNAQVGQLRLSERARIGGDLIYRSQEPAQIDPSASIAGTIDREEAQAARGRGAGLWVLRWLRAVIALFVLGLVLVLLFPGFTRRSVVALRAAPWKSLGLGALGVFGVPVAAFLLLLLGALLGGWWLSLMLLAIYAIALVVAFPVIAYFLGQWLLGQLRRPMVHKLLALLLGVALLTLAIRVPVLGAVVALAAVLFGLGAMILAFGQARRAVPA